MFLIFRVCSNDYLTNRHPNTGGGTKCVQADFLLLSPEHKQRSLTVKSTTRNACESSCKEARPFGHQLHREDDVLDNEDEIPCGQRESSISEAFSDKRHSHSVMSKSDNSPMFQCHPPMAGSDNSDFIKKLPSSAMSENDNEGVIQSNQTTDFSSIPLQPNTNTLKKARVSDESLQDFISDVDPYLETQDCTHSSQKGPSQSVQSAYASDQITSSTSVIKNRALKVCNVSHKTCLVRNVNSTLNDSCNKYLTKKNIPSSDIEEAEIDFCCCKSEETAVTSDNPINDTMKKSQKRDKSWVNESSDSWENSMGIEEMKNIKEKLPNCNVNNEVRKMMKESPLENTRPHEKRKSDSLTNSVPRYVKYKSEIDSGSSSNFTYGISPREGICAQRQESSTKKIEPLTSVIDEDDLPFPIFPSQLVEEDSSNISCVNPESLIDLSSFKGGDKQGFHSIPNSYKDSNITSVSSLRDIATKNCSAKEIKPLTSVIDNSDLPFPIFPSQMVEEDSDNICSVYCKSKGTAVTSDNPIDNTIRKSQKRDKSWVIESSDSRENRVSIEEKKNVKEKLLNCDVDSEVRNMLEKNPLENARQREKGKSDTHANSVPRYVKYKSEIDNCSSSSFTYGISPMKGICAQRQEPTTKQIEPLTSVIGDGDLPFPIFPSQLVEEDSSTSNISCVNPESLIELSSFKEKDKQAFHSIPNSYKDSNKTSVSTMKDIATRNCSAKEIKPLPFVIDTSSLPFPIFPSQMVEEGISTFSSVNPKSCLELSCLNEKDEQGISSSTKNFLDSSKTNISSVTDISTNRCKSSNKNSETLAYVTDNGDLPFPVLPSQMAEENFDYENRKESIQFDSIRRKDGQGTSNDSKECLKSKIRNISPVKSIGIEKQKSVMNEAKLETYVSDNSDLPFPLFPSQVIKENCDNYMSSKKVKGSSDSVTFKKKNKKTIDPQSQFSLKRKIITCVKKYTTSKTFLSNKESLVSSFDDLPFPDSSPEMLDGESSTTRDQNFIEGSPVPVKEKSAKCESGCDDILSHSNNKETVKQKSDKCESDCDDLLSISNNKETVKQESTECESDCDDVLSISNNITVKEESAECENDCDDVLSYLNSRETVKQKSAGCESDCDDVLSISNNITVKEESAECENDCDDVLSYLNSRETVKQKSAGCECDCDDLFSHSNDITVKEESVECESDFYSLLSHSSIITIKEESAEYENDCNDLLSYSNDITVKEESAEYENDCNDLLSQPNDITVKEESAEYESDCDDVLSHLNNLSVKQESAEYESDCDDILSQSNNKESVELSKCTLNGTSEGGKRQQQILTNLRRKSEFQQTFASDQSRNDKTACDSVTVEQVNCMNGKSVTDKEVVHQSDSFQYLLSEKHPKAAIEVLTEKSKTLSKYQASELDLDDRLFPVFQSQMSEDESACIQNKEIVNECSENISAVSVVHDINPKTSDEINGRFNNKERERKTELCLKSKESKGKKGILEENAVNCDGNKAAVDENESYKTKKDLVLTKTDGDENGEEIKSRECLKQVKDSVNTHLEGAEYDDFDTIFIPRYCSIKSGKKGIFYEVDILGNKSKNAVLERNSFFMKKGLGDVKDDHPDTHTEDESRTGKIVVKDDDPIMHLEDAVKKGKTNNQADDVDEIQVVSTLTVKAGISDTRMSENVPTFESQTLDVLKPKKKQLKKQIQGQIAVNVDGRKPYELLSVDISATSSKTKDTEIHKRAVLLKTVRKEKTDTLKIKKKVGILKSSAKGNKMIKKLPEKLEKEDSGVVLVVCANTDEFPEAANKFKTVSAVNTVKLTSCIEPEKAKKDSYKKPEKVIKPLKLKKKKKVDSDKFPGIAGKLEDISVNSNTKLARQREPEKSYKKLKLTKKRKLESSSNENQSEKSQNGGLKSKRRKLIQKLPEKTETEDRKVEPNMYLNTNKTLETSNQIKKFSVNNTVELASYKEPKEVAKDLRLLKKKKKKKKLDSSSSEKQLNLSVGGINGSKTANEAGDFSLQSVNSGNSQISGMVKGPAKFSNNAKHREFKKKKPVFSEKKSVMRLGDGCDKNSTIAMKAKASNVSIDCNFSSELNGQDCKTEMKKIPNEAGEDDLKEQKNNFSKSYKRGLSVDGASLSSVIEKKHKEMKNSCVARSNNESSKVLAKDIRRNQLRKWIQKR